MITQNTNINDIDRKLNTLKRQIPYATATALNTVLFGSQEALRKKWLPRLFQLRNAHTARSVRVTKANKRTLSGSIYSDAWYLANHISGNDRIPFKSKYIAVPTKAAWRNRSRRLPANNRPEKLFDRGRAFIGRAEYGNTRPAIVLRNKPRKGKGGKTRYTSLITMYKLYRRTSFEGKFPVDKIVKLETARRYPNAYKEALKRAYISAKG